MNKLPKCITILSVLLCSCKMNMTPLDRAEHHFKAGKYEEVVLITQQIIESNPSLANTRAKELHGDARVEKLLSEYDDAANSFNPIPLPKK